MRSNYQDEIADLIEQGFIENVNAIQTGNKESYLETAKTPPYIFTAKGFQIIAAIYFARITNAKNSNGKLPKFSVLTDSNPQHHNCSYSSDLDVKFKQIISSELLNGEIEFISIYGGHATLITRERLQDGTYQYMQYDSSTAIGGIYPPATQLYDTIRQVHPEAKIAANYDRTQKTTPGCHVQTLYVMLQLGLSLALGDKANLAAFMHPLDDAKKAELKAKVVNQSVTLFDKKSEIATQIDSVTKTPHHINHYGLFPEALCIAQAEEVFSSIEQRKRDARDESLCEKIKRNLDPNNPRFNLKSEKTLNKMLGSLIYYKNNAHYKNGTSSKFEIAQSGIDDETIEKIASFKGNSEKLLASHNEAEPHVVVTSFSQ